MKKGTKLCLIIAASLILIGCIVFGCAMTMLNWDFSKLTTHKYVTNHHEVSESFTNITVIANTADIEFLPSEDGLCAVECYEMEKAQHSVMVQDGSLVIRVEDNRKWYDHISIGFTSPKITVYLPLGTYGDLSVSASTGDVTISKAFVFDQVVVSVSTGDISATDLSASEMDLSVSTGKITLSDVDCRGDLNICVTTGDTALTNVRCDNITSNGSTGDLSLNHVMVTHQMSLERGTGDITFHRCDAGDIYVKTTTGDVSGTLLSEKIFIAQTNTGRVNVPNTTSGGKCKINTGTGNIKLNIEN